jgi:NMD protein affecting ribosome stability and mRNA decay
MNRTKLPEPTVCDTCNAVFSAGRWTWKEPPAQYNHTVCPACKRCADNYPAGKIKISGDFYHEHHEEILNLIQNIEKQEKSERPLERIMLIRKAKSGTEVTTTGMHIARRIGEALSRAYKGEYSFQYGDGEENIQVSWRR